VSNGQSAYNPWLTWCTGLLALAALIFVGFNIFLHRTNLGLQEDLANRQQFINESIRLSRLNTELIQALATLAAQTDDEAIRSLLASHGISFTINAPPTPGPGSSASEEENNE